MRLSAAIGSQRPDQIGEFAKQMQLLARRTGTIVALTISSPSGSSDLNFLAGILAGFPIDGHVFHINPSGDSSQLRSFLHAMMFRDVP